MIVVLLGPPGSGKSTIGGALGRVGFRWREWESYILDRWKTRENFVKNKSAALPDLQREIHTWISIDGADPIFETTGLSDASFLEELERDGRCLVVRLDVSEDEALRRVKSRPQGKHLTDDVELNRAVWQAFEQNVMPYRRYDLVINTEKTSPAAAVELILAAHASNGTS
jgi:AAA domain